MGFAGLNITYPCKQAVTPLLDELSDAARGCQLISGVCRWRARLAESEQETATGVEREAIGKLPNPLGLAGIEFVEYATTRPQAQGQVPETLGLRPVARHRSREGLLYRQGDMNVVINAHASARPSQLQPGEVPVIAVLGLRVRDAAAANKRALDRGAWAVPVQVDVMEPHIPAIHGVGATRIYFVDRTEAFSIWDVDFVPIPTVDRHPGATAGLHWFGIVQYIGTNRMDDWSEFYRERFGFDEPPDEQRFGILPKGRILKSPCGSFHLQLIEPEPGSVDVEGDESLQRMGLGTTGAARSTSSPPPGRWCSAPMRRTSAWPSTRMTRWRRRPRSTAWS